MFKAGIAFLFSISLISSAFASLDELDPPALNTAIIKKYTGLPGEFDGQKKVFKVFSPRDDLQVIVNGVKLTSAMGLSSWAAFAKINHSTVVKGELVLTENQIDPVLTAVLQNRLRVNSLHNHFLWDSPKVMFMHIEGAGNEQELALAISKVFNTIKMTSNGEGLRFPLAAIDTANTNLHTQRIETILGAKGVLEHGVYKIGVSRFATDENNQTLNHVVDASTQANFAGHDDGAVVDGDFAMHEENLQAVLSTLHRAGISIVAIHQRLTNDGQTRIVFLHYWGVGKLGVLALGVRAALDAAQVHAKELRVARMNSAQQVAAQVNAAQLNIEQLNTARELHVKQKKIMAVNLMLMNTAQQKSTLVNMAKLDAIQRSAVELATVLKSVLQNIATQNANTLNPATFNAMLQKSISLDEVALNAPLLNVASLSSPSINEVALNMGVLQPEEPVPNTDMPDDSALSVAPLNLALLTPSLLNESSQATARWELEIQNLTDRMAQLKIELLNTDKRNALQIQAFPLSAMLQNATVLNPVAANAPLLNAAALDAAAIDTEMFDAVAPVVVASQDAVESPALNIAPIDLAFLNAPTLNETAQQITQQEADKQRTNLLIASLQSALLETKQITAEQSGAFSITAMLQNATTLDEAALNAPLINTALMKAELLSSEMVLPPVNSEIPTVATLRVKPITVTTLVAGLRNKTVFDDSDVHESSVKTVKMNTVFPDYTLLNNTLQRAALLKATPANMAQLSAVQPTLLITLLNVASLNFKPINIEKLNTAMKPAMLASN